MKFLADLHIHSYLSRATAKNLNLEHLNLWAKLKGITVVGTGDFTHPQWFSELSKKLEPVDGGLFKLKPEFAAETAPLVPPSCPGAVRFALSVEISSIYKKDGKTRKVHNVVLVPTLDAASKINERLDQIGNIASDGRPILGLDSKALLEIVLEACDDAVLIPAHIWTPWFSVLGSKSGFDSIEECFEDLTPHIFAVETGLSSDPAMNWRVSSLDGLSLISNSDAHSPANLGREANLFDTDLSFYAMMNALRTGDSSVFLGTLEYFAEEGKYHFDGHRKCGVRLSPPETMHNKGLCPVCGKPVTIGVMYRVEELADRSHGEQPDNAPSYKSLLPLTDVLSEVLQVGPKSKKVSRAYRTLVEKIGPEFEILRNTSLAVLDETGLPLFSEAIKRMRENQVEIAPGFDGEFGTVSLFTPEEREQLLGQTRLFSLPSKAAKTHQEKGTQPSLFTENKPSVAKPKKIPLQKTGGAESDTRHALTRMPSPESLIDGLNTAQREAVCHVGGPLLIVAGPGTGKTRTLTYRIARLLAKGIARPEQVVAVTFTNKAAEEMRARLAKMVGGADVLARITIRTFHALCLEILTAETTSGEATCGKTAYGHTPHSVAIINALDQKHLVKMATEKGPKLNRRPEGLLNLISLAKQHMLGPRDDLTGVVPEAFEAQLKKIYQNYQKLLLKHGLLDFDDLIFKVVKLFETNSATCGRYREKFSFLSIDEYQDINFSQYRLVRLLAPPDHDICVIGDPDQAIYGFRGADVRYFQRFVNDYPTAKTVFLRQNYRSTETILEVSGQVIGAESSDREIKRTWSGIHGEKTITIAKMSSERSEAEYIVKTIDAGIGGISHFSVDSGRIDAFAGTKERSFGDYAVLYRVRNQAKALREAFGKSGIPFQSIGEKRLDSRRGMAEIVSCLKMGWSVPWDLDVERILNFSARETGNGTLDALKKIARDTKCSLYTALDNVGQTGLNVQDLAGLMEFRDQIQKHKQAMEGKSVYDQIQLTVNHFGFSAAMSSEEAFQGDLETLLAVARPFGHDYGKFLSCLALEKDQDLYDHRAEKVALLTIHASKGLEFPVVFVAGCEDGLIPYRTAKSEDSDLQEERRLFYVALTRAKEELYLTHATNRMWFGKRTAQQISPFLETIEEDLKGYEQPFARKRIRKKEDRQLSLF